VDTSIDGHRTPLEVLTERMLGAASQPVRFDWRNMRVGVGVTGSSLLELNNYQSARFGLIARRPVWGMMGEVGLTRVWTWHSFSSELLALTPYRQAGRPSRFELDVNLALPLAEGVATAWPDWFPATQLVFSANAGARYLFYPGSLKGLDLWEGARALISPQLWQQELQNLERQRLPAMQVDAGRFALLTGLSLDVYFHQGGFLSPRALIAVPLFSGFNGTGLGFWWELSLGMGWAF